MKASKVWFNTMSQHWAKHNYNSEQFKYAVEAADEAVDAFRARFPEVPIRWSGDMTCGNPAYQPNMTITDTSGQSGAAVTPWVIPVGAE